VIHLFVKRALKVDEAAFVLVQLIEQEPGIYDKRHPEYARRDKVDLAWEKISHEMKGIWYVCTHAHTHLYIYRYCDVFTGYSDTNWARVQVSATSN
jgi:hypothetical protein